MVDLTSDLQVCLSWGSIAESFHSLQSLSVSCFHVKGLPGPRFLSTCMSKAVLTAPLELTTCPYQQSLLSFRMRSRSSMPSCISSSLDLLVRMSCGLTLQICLIIALSFRCRPEERIGSSSLNFFQVVFTHVVVESSQPLAAESMSPRYQKEATTSSLSGQTPLRSAIQAACSSLAPCTSVIRVLCQALEPTAFLVHPVLAAVAEDAVDAHSSVTDST